MCNSGSPDDAMLEHYRMRLRTHMLLAHQKAMRLAAAVLGVPQASLACAADMLHNPEGGGWRPSLQTDPGNDTADAGMGVRTARPLLPRVCRGASNPRT